MGSTSDIARSAADVLRSGRLVAFPTETVYGLGADATNVDAVRKIFAAKGRPSTNPLIVHVSDAGAARRYARIWPVAADALAAKFWPGPLTLVVPKADCIVPEVSAGLATVGLRVPDHPLALELLRAFDGPIAAPSANRSSRISPTTAEHVRMELGSGVDLILDGGPCRVGIESTVLDLTRNPPMILRPGSVTREQIERVIGAVEVFLGNTPSSREAHSPGQQAVHYSPVAPAYRFANNDARRVVEWCRGHGDDAAAILLIEGSAFLSELQSCIGGRHRIIQMPCVPLEYARSLYAVLHEADAIGVSAIFIELPPGSPEWAAVLDRLTRATHVL
jgi:L-threonylcarbamoyladenylate synthase